MITMGDRRQQAQHPHFVSQQMYLLRQNPFAGFFSGVDTVTSIGDVVIDGECLHGTIFPERTEDQDVASNTGDHARSQRRRHHDPTSHEVLGAVGLGELGA